MKLGQFLARAWMDYTTPYANKISLPKPMRYVTQLNAEVKAIQQQMVEAKKSERADVMTEVNRLCKEFYYYMLSVYNVRNKVRN